MKTVHFIYWMILPLILAGVFCSNQPVQVSDGGGTETVIGMVLFESGIPAFGTRIEIVPVDYNPVSQGSLPDSMQAITDREGRYAFNALPAGDYNILARNTEDNEYFFRPQVTVSDEGVLSLVDTLRKSGVLKVILTDTVDVTNGYVFITGTTIYRSLAEGSVVQDGLYSLHIDNIPAATFSELKYSNTKETFSLIESFTVASLDTVFIEAFDYYLVIGSVKYENGVYASGTRVTIVPAEYIPVKDDPLPAFMHDTTGVNGEYVFKLTQKGTFNIQAVQPDKGVYMFHPNIAVDADTIAISPDKLTASGTLKCIVPDTIDDINGVIAVEGATLYTSLAQSHWLDTGFQVVYFDSLPAGLYSAMYYLPADRNPQKAIDTVTINSGRTVQREAFVRWYHYTTANSGLPIDNVLDIVIGSDGIKWFGTAAGAVSFDGSDWQVYNRSNSGLLSDSVASVALQGDSVVWFGTTNGVAKYTGTAWETFTSESTPLPDDSVFEVVVDNKGNLWIGTDSGAAVYDGNGLWDVYTPDDWPIPNIPGSEEIYCIAVDHDGVVWLGTDGGGIVTYDGSIWKPFNTTNSTLPSLGIFAIYVDGDNNKWIGTNGGVAVYNNTSWNFIHTGPHNNYKYFVSAIAVDKDNIKWFGTYEGGRLFRYDNTRMIAYNTKTSIITSNAYEMFTIQIDAKNYKWVSTSRGGVYMVGPID